MPLSAEQLLILRAKELPKDPETGDVHFGEPWQARIYCLVMALAHEGYCGWKEWTEDYLAVEIERAMRDEAEGRPARSYYEQWLDAAERMVSEKGLGSNERLFAKRLGAIQPGAVAQHWTRREPKGT